MLTKAPVDIEFAEANESKYIHMQFLISNVRNNLDYKCRIQFDF